MEKQTIKKQKTLFWVLTALMCIATALIHFIAIPDISSIIDPNNLFALQTCCFVSILIAIFIKPIIYRRTRKINEWEYYIIRTYSLTTAFLINILMSRLIGYESAYYCAAICFVMFLLNYPALARQKDTTSDSDKSL